MTQQEIFDRIEIQDTLVKYCHALDRRDWPSFAALFTENAELDYSAFGGSLAGISTTTEYLQAQLAQVRATQHTISTSQVEVDGETAKAVTAAQVMMLSTNADGSEHVLFVGLWYRDSFLKTSQGWKIQSRTQEYSWVHNAPPSVVR